MNILINLLAFFAGGLLGRLIRRLWLKIRNRQTKKLTVPAHVPRDNAEFILHFFAKGGKEIAKKLSPQGDWFTEAEIDKRTADLGWDYSCLVDDHFNEYLRVYRKTIQLVNATIRVLPYPHYRDRTEKHLFVLVTKGDFEQMLQWAQSKGYPLPSANPSVVSVEFTVFTRPENTYFRVYWTHVDIT